MNHIFHMLAVSAFVLVLLLMFFPRPQSPESIVKTCEDMGGTPSWATWNEGCKSPQGQEEKCDVEFCFLRP